ncbi:MAG: histone deacetylase [Polyangiaceae bacterium]|nr:histone deacetylase [Polyangiaceae bacterium]
MLPAGHKFPLGKYTKLHDTLEQEFPGVFILGAPATTDDLLLVHDADYVRAVTEGTLEVAAIRRLGFPWSESLVLRAQRSVGGTLAALSWAMQHGAGGHIAGGTHHAFVDHGEGFCVFNDLAVAVRVAQRDYGVERVAIVDLDVHQGNGTAAIFAGDPRVFTLSLHGEKNYPFKKEASSLDLGLPDQCTDSVYLAHLEVGLRAVLDFRPELVLFQSGVDSLAGDRLGRMSLSLEGLGLRDAMVMDLVRALGVPVVTTLGGGYGRDIGPTVQAHANVFRRLVRTFG